MIKKLNQITALALTVIALAFLTGCAESPEKTVILCEKGFHLTDYQVDMIEDSGMTDEFLKLLKPTPEQWKVIEATRDSFALDNVALQISDIMDKREDCLKKA